MEKRTQLLNSLALSAVASLLMAVPALADVPYPYNKLHLDQSQAQKIDRLDEAWKSNYSELTPQLHAEQRKLQRLLASPKADPLEITGAQQNLNHIREKLSRHATTNYLQKRRVLNADQQRELQQHLRRMVAERGNRAR